MSASAMLSVLRGIPGRVPGRICLRIYLLFFVAACVSFTQLAVVACVSLLAAALSSPESIVSSSMLASVKGALPGINWADSAVVLLMVAGGCVTFVVANNSLKLLNDYLCVNVAREVERCLGVQLLSGLLGLPYEWHVARNSSDLAMTVHWATHYGTLVRSAAVIVGDLLSVVIVLAGIFIIDPWIALCTVGLLGSFAGVLFSLMKSRLDYYSSEYRTTTLDNLRVVNMALQGVKDVKLFGREARLVEASDVLLTRCVRLAARQEVFRIAPMYILEVVGFLMIFGLVAWLLTRGGEASHIAGTVAFLAAAGWKLLPCVNKVLGAVAGLRVSWPFVQKAEEHFSEMAKQSSSSSEGEVVSKVHGLESGIALRDIDFSYQMNGHGLSNISMDIGKGQAIGVIGPSGGGKSTLVNIVSGLLSPGAGQILVDGEKLEGQALKGWQLSSVGYVPQAPYICDATLAENVAFGLWGDEIDRKWVLECCRMAAMDFIDDLPQGLDTPIGERGTRLSGGQQQRVAIARALYKQADVIIFDEATSALDTKSEKAIQDTIYSLKGQVTLIVVAHRLTTIEDCDQIYLIENGQVGMSGPARKVLDAYQAGGEG